MQFKSVISLSALTYLLCIPVSSHNGSSEKADPKSALFDMMDPAVLSASICGRETHRAPLNKSLQLVSLSGFINALSKTSATEIPIFDGLGDWSYPVSTASMRAQMLFDQGLKLTINFNHMEAIRSFRAAQKEDPDCAMCYWGEAFAWGPNINAPMDVNAYNPAYKALQHALSLKDTATPKEQAFINALNTRYGKEIVEDRSTLDIAFAQAMKQLSQSYPNDDYIGSLFAEAAMDTTPWDYWEDNGYTPKPAVADAILKIEEILDRNPNHPAAIHLYIHLTEASSSPRKAERFADRLAAIMPGAGHLVHMPSHTYYRIGRYIDSLKTNIKAVRADENYLSLVQPEGLYRLGYYPHNVHFVLVSAVMAGDIDAALYHAKKLDEILPMEFASTQPWVQPIKAAPYFAYAKLARPEDVMKLANPGDQLPFIQAIWHYARGEASIVSGNFKQAGQEITALETLLKTADFTDMIEGNVPAKDILKIAELSLKARISQETGQVLKAIEIWEKAALIQDQLIYTEPPYWYYPVRQSLGNAHLLNGNPASAIQAFQAALVDAPNNGWTIFGLAEAYERAGQPDMAAALRSHLTKSWVGSVEALALERL